MTVALSWSAEEGIRPDSNNGKVRMVAGARAYMEHMGWKGHQCLIVCHNDTAHPHAHLVINRIHPETGMAQDKAWVKHRSNQWALKYEREMGAVLCEGRVDKYELGQRRGPDGSLTRAQHETWQAIAKDALVSDRDHAAVLQSGEWKTLKEAQKAERLAFFKESGQLKRELRGEVARQVATEYAPQWAEYATYKAERDLAAKAYNAEARRAIKHMRSQGSLQGVAALQKKQDAYNDAHRADLWQHRQPIHEAQSARLAVVAQQALAALNKDRQAAYEGVKAAHRDERQELQHDQAAGKRRVDLLDKLHHANGELAAVPAARPAMAAQDVPGKKPADPCPARKWTGPRPEYGLSLAERARRHFAGQGISPQFPADQQRPQPSPAKERPAADRFAGVNFEVARPQVSFDMAGFRESRTAFLEQERQARQPSTDRDALRGNQAGARERDANTARTADAGQRRDASSRQRSSGKEWLEAHREVEARQENERGSESRGGGRRRDR